MRVPWQRFSSWAVSALPTAAILLFLVLLGCYGSATDWKAPSLEELQKMQRLSDLWHREEKKTEEGKEEKKEPEDENAPLAPVTIPAEKAERAGVGVSKVTRGTMGEFVRAHGEIDFDQYRYAHLTTRASGIVWRVEKQPGDPVRKGDLLALIASAELARLKNDFQQAMYQVEQRRLILERRQRASTALAGEQLIDASMALRDAKIRMLNDQQSLENLGLHVSSTELMKLEQEEIAERLRLLDIPEEIIRREGKDRITSNLLPMRAPFDGEVIQRDMVLGEMVTSGPPQLVIADLSNLWLRLYVQQEGQSKVKRGQKVLFTPKGGTAEDAVGTVRRISAEVDAKTRMVPVFGEVDNRDHRLRPNTFGDGRIRIGEHPALLVPSEAIQWDGHTFVVFIKTGENEYQPRRVRPGEKEEGRTEILSGVPDSAPGVKAGEEVVSAGSHVVKSEMLKARITGEE